MMFGSETRSWLKKNEIKKFIEIYARDDNWHHLDKENGGLGYGWVHYSLIRLLRPEKVLCVGSRYGYIPAICAMACRDNKNGIVDFVDAGYDQQEPGYLQKSWGGVGFWKKCNPEKYFGKFGLDKYIRLYVMRSEEYSKKNEKAKYGYVCIDGDHSYEGVKNDFEMFWPKVEKGGFMTFHDIGSPDAGAAVYGIRKFWKELKNKQKTVMEFLENPGLGLIQKYG
jgi:hypothetical protein